MAEELPLACKSAFAARLAGLPAAGGDIILAERTDLGIAVVMAGVDTGTSLAGLMTVPEGARARFVDGLTIVGTGPGTWLVVQDGVGADWAGQLGHRLAGMASVVDQSSGYALLRLSGSGARRLLARSAFVDFAPESFGQGAAAVTLIGHMGAIVWQRDEAPTYEIAVFRSYAASFWHALETAAAGFGARMSRAC